jgi:hypothetical protein
MPSGLKTVGSQFVLMNHFLAVVGVAGVVLAAVFDLVAVFLLAIFALVLAAADADVEAKPPTRIAAIAPEARIFETLLDFMVGPFVVERLRRSDENMVLDPSCCHAERA